MKSLKTIIGAALLGGFLAAPATFLAAEHEHHSAQPDQKKDAKLKPYLLKTCIVSGEKLGGDMGETYVYKYKDREIKFCCKSCLKDFNKDTAKFIKKLEAAEKAAGKDQKPSGGGHEGHKH